MGYFSIRIIMNYAQKAENKRCPPLVSIILISMNRKEMLENCLRSVQRQVFQDVEIIVVDNASSDGTGDMVQTLFPGVRYFYLSDNLGVPGGRNYAVRKSEGEFCVFIDDDAIFADNNAINRVVMYFQSDFTLGCIAFRIVQPSDEREEYKGIPRADKKTINTDYECSYFCGAGFACRRSLFIETGMFWEPLFYSGEELDFCYRLVNQGHTILRSSAISVIHCETPHARIKGEWIYYGARSRFLVAARNLPWIKALSHILLWWGYFLIYGIKTGHIFYFFRGVIHAIIDLPKALQTRSCITRKTIGKLTKLSGRIYY
jgi:GT2 family glycosyltransferase